MFDDEALLEGGRRQAVFANERFMTDMREISEEINEKSFKKGGIMSRYAIRVEGNGSCADSIFLERLSICTCQIRIKHYRVK
jgi:hypothetical protein